jgi:hypothetical protein
VSHFLCDAAYSFGLDQSDGETSEATHICGTVSFADSRAVFIVVPIDDVMAGVFDSPMAAVDSEDFLGI